MSVLAFAAADRSCRRLADGTVLRWRPQGWLVIEQSSGPIQRSGRVSAAALP